MSTVYASNQVNTTDTFVMALAAYDADGRLLAVNISNSYTPTSELTDYYVTLENFENAAKFKLILLKDATSMIPLGAEEVPSPEVFQ